MTRKKVIAGNWKMHKTVQESAQFVKNLRIKVLETKGVDIILCAPFTSLFHMSELLDEMPVGLGAENMHWADQGAYTGEISAEMLKSAGCEFVILGHSERRQYFGETDETVGKKVSAALNADLKPIVCIGETLEQRNAEQVEEVLTRQLEGAFSDLNVEKMAPVTIAYEPVWAIGTGENATPEQAVEAHQLIRGWLNEHFGDDLGSTTTVLYGGSMKPANAKDLLKNDDIDGGLIGGASLDVDKFAELVSIAEELS